MYGREHGVYGFRILEGRRSSLINLETECFESRLIEIMSALDEIEKQKHPKIILAESKEIAIYGN